MSILLDIYEWKQRTVAVLVLELSFCHNIVLLTVLLEYTTHHCGIYTQGHDIKRSEWEIEGTKKRGMKNIFLSFLGYLVTLLRAVLLYLAT